MTFSIGGKLVGGLLTATSVSATVAAPYVPKLIDKYVLTSSSSKVESFSSDSSYPEESEVVVSDESFVSQTVKVAEEKIPVVETDIKTPEKVVEPSATEQKPVEVKMTSYTIPEGSSRLTDDQLKDNQDAYDRIKKWIDENGSCQISFVIKSSKNLALDFKNIERDNLKSVEIFVKDNKLGKSKFKSFADQLDSQVESDSKYINKLSEMCKVGSSKKFYLHWRDKVTESKMSEFKGLKNVWVDHESLFNNSNGLSFVKVK